MPKNTVDGGASNLNDPDMDPRSFVSTGEAATEYRPEPELTELPQGSEVEAGPPAPSGSPTGDGPSPSIVASGDLIVDKVTVPDGTIDDVKSWVGSDLGRAQAALDVERAKASPRSGLVTYLEKVLVA